MLQIFGKAASELLKAPRALLEGDNRFDDPLEDFEAHQEVDRFGRSVRNDAPGAIEVIGVHHAAASMTSICGLAASIASRAARFIRSMRSIGGGLGMLR
jgi:hypothetical protein